MLNIRNTEQNKRDIAVTVHIPENVQDAVKQTKINPIYDILSKKDSAELTNNR